MKEKEVLLLDAAFKLFTEKGFTTTTIQEIVDEAHVAKGTFYLYFEDKYDIQEKLIIKESYNLFHNALDELEKTKITKFENQIIFIIDSVINKLTKNPKLITFITKNLSSGLFNEKLSDLIKENNIGVRDLFINAVKENKIKLKNPEVTLYLIIELVGSSCFSSITKNIPLPINELKPFLYDTIKKILQNN